MDHSIARAIRTVGEKICRRLDVLIEAAGQPPVEDIEGTNAPRKPLAPSAAKKNHVPCAVSPNHQEALTTIGKKRGRGRPPKNQVTPTPGETLAASATSEIDSAGENCEASFFLYMCVLFSLHNIIGRLLREAQFVFSFAWSRMVGKRDLHEARNATV